MNILNNKSHVRFSNDLSDTNNISIYINGEVIVDSLPLGEKTSYLNIPYGNCNIEIFPINQLDKPIINSVLDIPRDSKLTIVSENISNSPTVRTVIDTPILQRCCNTSNNLRIDSSIRVLHAVPNFTNIDVYANGNLIVSNLSFSSKSQYFNLSPGEYIIEIFETGLKELPLISEKLNLDKSSNYTVSVAILDNSPYLLQLKDGGIPVNPMFSYIRFINLSPNSPLLNMQLPNGSILFEDVEYLETTGYYATSPGIYNFKVEFSNVTALYKNIKNINMVNNEMYTIYILGLFNEDPPIGYLWVEDKNR